jgi:peptidyl-prolyl cis-trans isomerase C
VTKRMLLFVLLVVGVACQRSPAAQAPPASSRPGPATQAAGQPQGQAAAPQVKPVPEQLPATIARVNGETIAKDEFERALKSLEARVGQPVPAEKRAEVYRGLLDQMIAYKLLLQESKTLKVSVPDSDIDGRIKQIQGQFPNEQAFAKALSDQHVTVRQLKDDQRQQMIVAKVIDAEVNSKVAVTPKDVDDFYAKNPDKFKEPEGVHAAHILIRTPQGADAAAKAKAKAEAEAILKQVQGGGDFAKLAREKSQDPGSAPNGGDLNFLAKGQMAQQAPQFEEAAFKLKPGEVSPVVESPFGFHIIKMLERRPARTVPLEEARPQVTEFLKQQQASQKTVEFIDQLKAKSKIEVYI